LAANLHENARLRASETTVRPTHCFAAECARWKPPSNVIQITLGHFVFVARGSPQVHGARAGAVKNWKVLETIAGKTSLVIDFGGGIKTEKDVEIVFNSGSALATVGSIAVKNEEEFIKWLLNFGAGKFLLGADVKNEKITVSGWQEETKIWVYHFIQKYIDHGVKQIFCTDVSKDGKLEGPALDLYKNIISKFPELFLIASGGVSSVDDLKRLEEIGCKAAIVGKAIYENKITLQQLMEFNLNAT